MVPGLNINTNNGSGVSSSRIVLRGEASLNIDKNQPLIVVDGVVVSNNLDGFAGTGPRIAGTFRLIMVTDLPILIPTI
jgi:outer membrane cobalamin receptor